MGGLDASQVLAIGIVIFLAIGLHEYAHCKFADLAGDPTPRYYGRVTLNLTKHFELFGTIMIVLTSLSGFGIGWGKPAPMDPRKMRNPRWDFFMAVAAGPISNLLQAVLWGLVYRLLPLSSWGTLESMDFTQAFLVQLAFFGVLINVSLMCFNLLPLGMLDGHWLLGTFLPERTRAKWYLWNRQYGVILLIGIVLIGQFSPELSLFRHTLYPIVNRVSSAILT